ncbi:hypothetical protein K491DRAFT_427547 [Lophiostoma macrostomum CBS 122681]|uniref:Uncharacterized protein n=1 Tax=Lophiostoma macrostomum CBS 122681 TaxID=1314788 RepID=A0A6A6T5W4_9PLEO|nr:hypothetical protein K491DRAFT_427547 [Lophiostoma macrostomum CBS 122681]
MIDSHLADQVANEPARPDSRGTMFVDWDGSGEPIISYRNQRNSSTPTSDPERENENWREEGHEVRYIDPNSLEPKHRRRNHERSQAGPEASRQHESRKATHGRKPYIEGHDAETGFSYDYDGDCFHVHRSRPSSAESKYSEYYQLDAAAYSPTTALLVVDKDLPALPSERSRRDRVVGFIDRVLQKLNSLGLLKKLKDDHRRKLCVPPKPTSGHKRPSHTRPSSYQEKNKRRREGVPGITEHSGKRTQYETSGANRHTMPEVRRPKDTPSRRRQAAPSAGPSTPLPRIPESWYTGSYSLPANNVRRT